MVMLLVVATACGEGQPSGSKRTGANRAPDDASGLFGESGVAKLELTIERSAMSELAREPRDWVRASLRIGGARQPTHKDVAIHFKGHRSLRTWAEKPAFKLDFDKHSKGRRIVGLEGLVLNNLVEDPTMLRENIGSRVFAALGVAAPRTGFAELFINGELFGLYAVIEPVDERFLARHFEGADGPVFEGEYGCDLYEGDVWAFEQDSGDDEGRRHLLALARAAEGPPSEWLLSGDDEPLVNRSFIAYLAGSALLGDFDGYRHAHNYRVFRDAKSEQWSFIPWGLDRILKKRVAVFDSNGRLARSCFQDRACRLEYVKALHQAARRFESLSVEKLVESLATRIASAAERDPRRPYTRKAREKALVSLRQFVVERPAEVRAQVACWDGTRELDRDADGAACTDCNDEDPAIFPGAEERCDGKDNDCSGNVDDSPSCDCPTVSIGDASFSLCALPMSWWHAKAFCEARGQMLARIDSKQISKELHNAARPLHDGTWWVGLDDQAREGRFRWQDGSSVKRSLWADAEPDNYACGQHCAALIDGGRGRLRDQHCATLSPFICGSRPPPPRK